MTRDEFFAQRREEFIQRHLALPGWMARLPSWLREYLRLLYWVFFKPSALRLHLASLAPEAVDKWGRVRLRGLRVRAVRALVARALLLTLLLPALGTLLAGLAASALGVPFDWVAAWIGVALGVAWGVTGGVAGGVASGVAFGVAGGVAWGVAWGVALGVALGVARGVAWGVAGSMAWGVAWGVALGVARGVAFGVALGVALGVAGGVVGGVAFMAGALIGAIRLPFWFGEALLARLGSPLGALAGDELPVLPLPGLARQLREAVARDPAEGAHQLAYVARHLYARWALSRALASLLHARPGLLLGLLRPLLYDPLPYVEPRVDMDADASRREADPYFSTKLVLAECASARIIPGGSEALVRSLTADLRRPLPLLHRQLCRAMLDLLEAAAPTDPRRFDPAALPGAAEAVAAALEPFRQDPLGSWEAALYRTLARFLRMESLSELTGAPRLLEPLFAPSPYGGEEMEEVLTALRRLGDVGRAVEAYRAASSELARRDRLTEAQSALDQVRRLAAISPAVYQPVAALLEQIAGRWYGLVAAERDAIVAARPVAPLEDLYVVGPALLPESGRLFVGRDDIFRRIEELWRNPLQKTPIVLHGQRRMGKTSILNHLEQRLGPRYVVVKADLQGLLSDPQRPIRSDADLWRALAHQVARRVSALSSQPVHPAPDEPFEEFLNRLHPLLGDRFLVLMLDEFEKLEQKMDEGAVSSAFLEYLRHLMQDRRELLVLLAGHHTLAERLRRYWEPLMGIARPVRVSYLEEDDARRLLTDPWDGFRLQYTEEGLRRILEATGCQPLLLQLAGSAVIQEVNGRMKREGYEDYPTARMEEIEAALEKMLKAGETYFFDAVWDWLTEPQRMALERLARAYRKGSQGWIEGAAVPDVDGETLRALVEREVLEELDGRYRFRVELLRRWVVRRSEE